MSVERNRACRIEPSDGMASKSICSSLSAYTLATCKNAKLTMKPQMIDGITNMTLYSTISTMTLILLRPTMRITPSSKLFDSIESISSE